MPQLFSPSTPPEPRTVLKSEKFYATDEGIEILELGDESKRLAAEEETKKKEQP